MKLTILGQDPPKLEWDGSEPAVDELIKKFKLAGKVLGRDADVAYFMASIAAVEDQIRLDWKELEKQPRARAIAEEVMAALSLHYDRFRPSYALAGAKTRNFMSVLQRLGFL